jgi:hypothetical protein
VKPGTIVTAFTLGALFGGTLVWGLATAAERFRRIRHDLRAVKKALKTLRRMLVREAKTLATTALVVALVVAVTVVALTR